MLKSILFGFFCFTVWSIIAVGSLFLGGCGGDEGDTYNTYVESNNCTTGSSAICACPGGVTGYQVCNSYGTFDTCRCPKPEADAGPEASTEEDAAVEPDTGSDAQAEAEVDSGAESGNDAEADAYIPPLLTYSFIGPQSAQYADPGTNDVVVLEFEMHSYAALEIRRMPVYFRSANGAVLFSSGTNYLQNLRVRDQGANVTLMGPRELPGMIGPNGENAGCVNDCVVEFNDSFVMHNGDTRRVGIVVNLAETEVNPGDFYEGRYTAELSWNQGDVFDLNTNQVVPLSQIAHPTQMMGAWTNVTVPLPPVNQLSIQLSVATPQSTILNAGVGTDKLFSIYSLSNGTNHPVTFDRVGVQEICSDGFSCKKNISCLVAEVKGFKMSTSVLDPIGATQIPPLVNGESVTLQPGESADVRISACLQALMPHSIQGTDLPRSGDSLYLQLFSVSNGGTLIAFTESTIGTPNPMVLRKSKPIVTPQQLVSNVLTNGELELARWQVGANGINAIAQKQTPFYMEWDTGVSLNNFRLYRGAVQVPASEYSVVDMASGTDLFANSAPALLGTFPIVAFTDQESVSGNGSVYSLRANINVSGLGHHVFTKFINPGSENITGGLVNNIGLMPPEVANANLWHVQQPGGGYGIGLFIWSDLSELPHSMTSFDWITGYLVENLDHIWTLSN